MKKTWIAEPSQRRPWGARREKLPTTASHGAVSQEEPRPRSKRGMHHFVHQDRATQVAAFLAWLPREMHEIPGMDWTELAPQVMQYCIGTVGNSPDAVPIAAVAASLHGALAISSQRTLIRQVSKILRELRAQCGMQCLDDLRHEQVWYAWVTQQSKKTDGPRQKLSGYTAIATGHYPRYLLRLSPAERIRMQQYALPAPPVGLAETSFPVKVFKATQQARRKAEVDILVPLYPVLRQLVRFRKQLAERTLLAIREAKHKVEAGEVSLPYHFQHIDTLPEVNRDARTVAEVRIEGREVTLSFTLWDKRTWVLHHQDRYDRETIRHARRGHAAYSSSQNCFFVQFEGKASELWWIGDLVEHHLFQRFDRFGLHQQDYQKRWRYARQIGFSKGCYCMRPGLLTPSDRWFAEAAARGNELIFEPESLYRGVLYGAALTMLALSNGSRMNELLQVSWNRERRITRTETVVLLGEDGHPRMGEDGKPLTKQVKLHFQHLLPKGAKTEEERQLFPLSRECMRLLGEIKTLLEQTHGEIPIVAPSRSNAKYEHLKPERYLFQWAATASGEIGALYIHDVETLLRFMLHGMDMYTAQGHPIRVCVHVIRHVMATHARYYRNVPPEAIAWFFLHHRFKELTGRSPSLSEVSEYYTQMPEAQRFAIISADLDEQEEIDHALLPPRPGPRDLEQMNAELQAVFELWHALHPTALGHCGCPGLCPREGDRALCLGCSYLVTDPERMSAALSWRTSYAKLAELLEAQGNFVDARQARLKVQQLDDVLQVMRLQLQAEADGSYIPLSKILPSPYRKKEEA
jgi:hypothetical protein